MSFFPSVDSFLSQTLDSREWYKIGNDLFDARIVLGAKFAFRHYAQSSGRGDLISGFHADGPFSVKGGGSRRSLRKFFDERFKLWEIGAIPMPTEMRRGSTQHLASFVQSTRLLYFGTEHVFHSRSHIQTPILDHVLGSARAVGLEIDSAHLDDAYSNAVIGKNKERNAGEILADLFAIVDRVRPDVIIFDGNEIRDDAPVSPASLEKLRSNSSAKFVTFFFDAWTERGIAQAESWANVSDLLVHFAPGSPLETYEPLRHKTMLAPCPMNTSRYYVDDAPKDVPYTFIGTTYQHLRPFYLSFLLNGRTRQFVHGKPFIHTHSSDSKMTLTYDQYAASIRRSRMCVDFTSRGNGPDDFGIKVLTGRTWHALFTGSLLLQEESVPITRFLVPYIHYVPFLGVKEMLALLRFFEREPYYRVAIVRHGLAACHDYYAPEYFWDALLSRILGSKTDADLTVP
jgi:hypothetical protein